MLQGIGIYYTYMWYAEMKQNKITLSSIMLYIILSVNAYDQIVSCSSVEKKIIFMMCNQFKIKLIFTVFL